MKSFSKIVIVGGPISVGKSSLIDSLGLPSLKESQLQDELQEELLKSTYNGDELSLHVLQLDIMLNRFEKYKEISSTNKRFIFTRSIFEDFLFASILIGHNNNIWEYYFSIWKDKVNQIIKQIGKPEFYILLSCNWDNFVKRLNKEDAIESSTFAKNEDYFKKVIKDYVHIVVELLKKYHINHIVIDTNNLSNKEVYEKVNHELSKRGII